MKHVTVSLLKIKLYIQRRSHAQRQFSPVLCMFVHCRTFFLLEKSIHVLHITAGNSPRGRFEIICLRFNRVLQTYTSLVNISERLIEDRRDQLATRAFPRFPLADK